MEIKFQANLWEWQGKGAWCFITLPPEYYNEIKSVGSSYKKGFGSVRVEVIVGSSTWNTSVFPDTKSKSYILPMKKEIRKAEKLEVGSAVQVLLKIKDM